jgi:hypothetical protein
MPKDVYKRTPETCDAISKGQKGIPKSPEACAAMSKAHTSIPLSPEHCAAIAKCLKNSDAVKSFADSRRGVPRTPEARASISKGMEGVPRTSEAQIAADKAHGDAQRGGYDVVNHHYLYDHSDLSLNTVGMTRSDHTRLHWLLWKLGVEVPHINEDN